MPSPSKSAPANIKRAAARPEVSPRSPGNSGVPGSWSHGLNDAESANYLTTADIEGFPRYHAARLMALQQQRSACDMGCAAEIGPAASLVMREFPSTRDAIQSLGFLDVTFAPVLLGGACSSPDTSQRRPCPEAMIPSWDPAKGNKACPAPARWSLVLPPCLATRSRRHAADSTGRLQAAQARLAL